MQLSRWRFDPLASIFAPFWVSSKHAAGVRFARIDQAIGSLVAGSFFRPGRELLFHEFHGAVDRNVHITSVPSCTIAIEEGQSRRFGLEDVRLLDAAEVLELLEAWFRGDASEGVAAKG